jgi:SAM-dependent methyltransferase
VSGNLRIEPFVRHHARYDEWFERHGPAYISELLAVRALLPWKGRALEIGVGTGRFAGPLGVKFGIDPVPDMLSYAQARSVSVAAAVAEALPFADGVFDCAIVVTTICFVDDPRRMLHEIGRVLRPGGKVIIAFIDRESPLGQEYVSHRTENVFYSGATFYSTEEIGFLLKETGFSTLDWVQTLSKSPSEMRKIEPISAGAGRGAFIVVRARTMREADAGRGS